MMKDYLSFSSLKSFTECEAEAVAVMAREWDRRATFSKATLEAMLAGQYVHKYFESLESFEQFKAENGAEMLTKTGSLKAQFQIADKMVKVLDKDPLFKAIYHGSKEVEIWGEISGIKFKGFIDCLNLEKDIFIDIKTLAKSIRDKEWSDKEHRKLLWIEARKYHWQMAIYQELLRQHTDEHISKEVLPIVYVVTKEPFPDSAGIQIPQFMLDEALEEVKEATERYKEVLDGRQPERCESCNYCKATKRNTRTILVTDLM